MTASGLAMAWLSLPCLLAAAPVLRLEPPEIALQGPGSVQRLIATAVDVHGDETDVTRQCSIRSSDPSVATFEDGRIVGKAGGSARMTATCGESSAETAVKVGLQAAEMEVDFSRDLLSILTTKSCNGSGCHGSPAGQAGFKLSLYGSNPQADYQTIVHGDGGRRVNLDAPKQSLILQKPSFEIAHGGGHLMSADSQEYRTILSWLEQGARFDSSGASIHRLEVYPRERILVGPGARQPITVTGRLSDGSTRDMTDEVSFSVADDAVISNVEDGAVTAKGRGLTTLMARALGKTATAQFIVIGERAGENYAGAEPENFIDRHVFEKLRRVNIDPYPVTGDRAFVRRVFVDAIGVLPTPEEAETFVADGRPDKRARLIDGLLEREEYALHWLVKLEDWFRNSQYYSQGRTNGSFKRWLHEMARDDWPYDETVREMLTAVGDTTVRPAGNFWHPSIDFMIRTFEVNKAAPTVTRLFLGQRIECAECHNHPLENLTQDDFYGMAAFLAQVRVKHGYGQYRRVWYDAREGEVEHPVTKKPVEPRFLDGSAPRLEPGVTRREALAEWITRDQQSQFARATVNRIWAEYFKRGIVEPFDDFRSTNMPTHPGLLDDLADFFVDSRFRFKALHRLILNSKTYQLSAHTGDRPGGEDPLEEMLFARYKPRRMPAETMLDAIVQVTGVAHEFPNYPAGTSPKELVASIGAPYFLTTFGFPRRDVMEARAEEPSLSQALHLMNSETVRDKVTARGNVLDELLDSGGPDREIVDALYLRAYSRKPSEEQWRKVSSYLRERRDDGQDRRRTFETLLWAILNSKEFQLNR